MAVLRYNVRGPPEQWGFAVQRTGSASGEIYLWQFGAKTAMAGYTPLAASQAALPSWSESMFAESTRAWSASTATFASWGQPQSVRFSDCGERFAAVGEGGGVATWRLDAPRYTSTDTGTLGRADWCHQVSPVLLFP